MPALLQGWRGACARRTPRDAGATWVVAARAQGGTFSEWFGDARAVTGPEAKHEPACPASCAGRRARRGPCNDEHARLRAAVLKGFEARSGRAEGGPGAGALSAVGRIVASSRDCAAAGGRNTVVRTRGRQAAALHRPREGTAGACARGPDRNEGHTEAARRPGARQRARSRAGRGAYRGSRRAARPQGARTPAVRGAHGLARGPRGASAPTTSACGLWHQCCGHHVPDHLAEGRSPRAGGLL